MEYLVLTAKRLAIFVQDKYGGNDEISDRSQNFISNSTVAKMLRVRYEKCNEKYGFFKHDIFIQSCLQPSEPSRKKLPRKENASHHKLSFS